MSIRSCSLLRNSSAETSTSESSRAPANLWSETANWLNQVCAKSESESGILASEESLAYHRSHSVMFCPRFFITGQASHALRPLSTSPVFFHHEPRLFSRRSFHRVRCRTPGSGPTREGGLFSPVSLNCFTRTSGPPHYCASFNSRS